MANVPEGAQLSDDHRWWWDANEQKWQPVEDDAASAAGDAGAAGSGDDRSAARVAQGLPPSLTDITDEQRGQYIGEPTVTVETVEQGEVDTVAMDDSGGENNEAIA
jgi:hypothetical protein